MSGGAPADANNNGTSSIAAAMPPPPPQTTALPVLTSSVTSRQVSKAAPPLVFSDSGISAQTNRGYHPAASLDFAESPLLYCCCCLGAAQVCREANQQCATSCVSSAKLVNNSAVVLTLLVVVPFLFGWGIFIGAAIWSDTYYDEYYAPLEEALANGSLPKNATVYEIGGFKINVPRSKSGIALPSSAMSKYFPTKFVHWGPGLIATIAFAFTSCFSPAPQSDLLRLYKVSEGEAADDEDPTKQRISHRDRVKSVTFCSSWGIFMSVSFSTIALIYSLIVLIMTVSFVEHTMGTNFFFMVPTLAMCTQTVILCFALAMLYLGISMRYNEQKQARADQFHVA